MKKYYIILAGIVGIYLFVACNESNIPTFSDSSDIYYVNIDGDESEISFDLVPVADTSYTITARLMGLASDQDMVVNIVATDSTTAIEGEHYTLSECVIPANKVVGECTLTLFAPDTLAEGDSLVIELEVLKSGEWLPGIDTKLRYKIVAGLPNNWPTFWALFCYGNYSKVKYRFLLELYGSAKAIDDAANSFQWDGHRLFVYKALLKYEEENGEPLKDENGNEVTVPITI